MTNQTNSDESDMLRPSEAALLLGIHPKTLARMAFRGSIQSIILPSGHRRYSREDIYAMRGAS